LESSLRYPAANVTMVVTATITALGTSIPALDAIQTRMVTMAAASVLA
jgi:hypothetical protein